MNKSLTLQLLQLLLSSVGGGNVLGQVGQSNGDREKGSLIYVLNLIHKNKQ